MEWKNRIAKEGLATQNPVLVLAMLKYFSAQETLSANECEWTRFQLAECAAKGQYLAFMKDFKGKMEVPFEIENAQMLEWIAPGKGDVYIEINKEKLLPMYNKRFPPHPPQRSVHLKEVPKDMQLLPASDKSRSTISPTSMSYALHSEKE